MANFKHKVFLLIAKWIPVAVAAGILINNTLVMLDVKDVILDLFDITVGSSLAFVIMMYACSYVFNFCHWHKIVITYDLFVLLYILLIRYTNIGECSDGLLLTIHYILAGIFIALIWYVMKNLNKLMEHYKQTVRIDANNAWDIICHFKEAVCENTNVSEESLFEIMKDFYEKLIGKHFTEPYALYQVSQMYHINNKGIKIDAPLFSIEATKKIYDRRIRPLNKDVTMWDVYVALNAQYHDNINLYEKWFPNATNNEIEDKIVEATTSNWFEDEDASSDKVWEYFRVI